MLDSSRPLELHTRPYRLFRSIDEMKIKLSGKFSLTISHKLIKPRNAILRESVLSLPFAYVTII